MFSRLRLCFAGTPAFAADHLSCLIDKRYRIAAVYTQPDRPSGRGRETLSSPVKKVAEMAGLRVVQPRTLRDAAVQQQMREFNADLLIVVAYGLILPRTVLNIPRLGCINVHASLLPRWRGAAPVERAILAGDEVTGVSIMQMDAGLDTGPVLHTISVAIDAEDDRETLTSKLSCAGQQALLHSLQNLSELRARTMPQDDSCATYAGKVEKSEALIDWTQDASQVAAVIRAGIGRYPAYSLLGSMRIRLLSGSPVSTTADMPPGTVITVEKDCLVIACANSALAVKRVQLPGKNPVSVKDLLNSNRALITSGIRFGDSADPAPA